MNKSILLASALCFLAAILCARQISIIVGYISFFQLLFVLFLGHAVVQLISLGCIILTQPKIPAAPPQSKSENNNNGDEKSDE